METCGSHQNLKRKQIKITITIIIIIIKLKTSRAVEHVAKDRMSLSHIVHALYFIVTVAGLRGHPVLSHSQYLNLRFNP
jgi:hypothetical protein